MSTSAALEDELIEKIGMVLDGATFDDAVPALAWCLADVLAELTENQENRQILFSALSLVTSMYTDICTINNPAPEGATIN